MRQLFSRRGVVAGLAAVVFWGGAMAQGYPTKPVKFVVPTAPGGAWDILARNVAQKLSEAVGTTFYIENRGGAGTAVGAQAVAIAPPDGYTMLVAGMATIALAPAITKQLPYDPAKDFRLVSLLSTHSYMLVGRGDLPVNDVAGLIKFAKEKNGLTVATAGNGTGQQIAAALFAQRAGIKIVEVPYKGAGAIYPDVLAGRVDLFFDTTSVAAPQVLSGKLKGFMVSSPTRSPLVPKVPTAEEVGLKGFEMEGWVGIFAPANTPTPIVTSLRDSVKKVTETTDFKQTVEKAGGRVLLLSDAQSANFIDSEVKRWGVSLRDAGIKAE